MTENLQSISLVMRALVLAERLHKGQLRKYTGEPYIVHLHEVGALLHQYGMPPFVVAAGILHDALEDTSATREEISSNLGATVAMLVAEVTDPVVEGNRATRKAAARAHLAKASPWGKAIKLADLVSNTKSIVEHDPKFAAVYLAEKEALLEVLKGAASLDLYSIAYKKLWEGKRAISRIKS